MLETSWQIFAARNWNVETRKTLYRLSIHQAPQEFSTSERAFIQFVRLRLVFALVMQSTGGARQLLIVISTDSTQYSFFSIWRNRRRRKLVPRINWLRLFWTARINQSQSIESFHESMRWSQYVLSLQSVACAFRSTFIKIFDYNRMINVIAVPIRYDYNDGQDLFIRKVSEAINCFVNLEIFTNLFFFLLRSAVVPYWNLSNLSVDAKWLATIIERTVQMDSKSFFFLPCERCNVKPKIVSVLSPTLAFYEIQYCNSEHLIFDLFCALARQKRVGLPNYTFDIVEMWVLHEWSTNAISLFHEMKQ